MVTRQIWMKFRKVSGIILNKFCRHCVAMQNPGSYLGNPKFVVILSQLSFWPARQQNWVSEASHPIFFQLFCSLSLSLQREKSQLFHFHKRREKPAISLSLQREKSKLIYFHYRGEKTGGERRSLKSLHNLKTFLGQRRNGGKHFWSKTQLRKTFTRH